jgi:pyridoxine 5-phosphate synthase
VSQLVGAKIRVSLFVEPHPVQLAVAKALGAQVVELHTGAYCEAHAQGDATKRDRLLAQLRAAAKEAERIGLEVHAGHGLSFETVAPVAAIPQVAELNIGHFLVGEAIFTGLDAAIRRMRQLMDEARGGAGVAVA